VPRSPRYGNAREVKVAQEMERDGWLVGSRRHMGGAGDLLAVIGFSEANVRQMPGPRRHDQLLIEVKGNSGSPYMNFRAEDRKAMVETAAKVGAEPWLAWWPPGGELQWIPAADWPS
jgi:Holliday junction resolvase